MRIRLTSLALLFASTIGQTCRCETFVHQTKGEALVYLQTMRENNVKRLRDIDQALRTKVGDEATADADIVALRSDRHEHLLRQEFLGRLIFQVDTRYAGGDMRLFLQQTLRDLARTDVIAGNDDDQSLWKFMKYAAEVLAGATEKREDALAFLDGYMQRSVSRPVAPKVFLASLNYSNGLRAEAGHPLRADLAGAIADQRTREAKILVPTKLHPKR